MNLKNSAGLLFCAAAALAADSRLAIRVDQVGYLTAAPKIAMITAGAAARQFSVRRVSDEATVYQGKLSPPVEDADSGDRVQAADFSKLATAGVYYIDVTDVGR